MPYFSFDQYEAEALAHLAEHFDHVSRYLDIDNFYKCDELGRDAVMKTIERFIRLELIEMQTRRSIEIDPKVFDVVAQLRCETEPTPESPSTVNYNILGANARINVNSIDNSANTVSVDHSVFNEICEIINSQIGDSAEQEVLLKLVAEMKESAGSPSFLGKYKQFMATAANHTAVFAPVISELAQMVR